MKKVKSDKKINIDTVYASSIDVPLKIEPMKDPTCLRTEYFVPSFAVDGANGSRWMSAAEDSINPWIVADLGTVKKVRRSEIYFVRPTAGHAYVIEASIDGKVWQEFAVHQDRKMCSPHTDVLNKRFRYLRIKILKGVPGIWEWNIY